MASHSLLWRVKTFDDKTSPFVFKIMTWKFWKCVWRHLWTTIVYLNADGKLYSGTWTCVNTTTGSNNVNTQVRKDFETYVEKTVNASKYSASRDKVQIETLSQWYLKSDPRIICGPRDWLKLFADPYTAKYFVFKVVRAPEKFGNHCFKFWISEKLDQLGFSICSKKVIWVHLKKKTLQRSF